MRDVVFKQCHTVFHHVTDRKDFIPGNGDFGKIGKGGSNRRHVVNLFYQYSGYFFEAFFKFNRVFYLERTKQKLNIQFHRSQGVFDLMGNLSGHFPPSSLPFGFGKLVDAVFQFFHHFIVFFDQTSDFIFPVVFYFLILPTYPHGFQFIIHKLQGFHHPLGNDARKDESQYHYHDRNVGSDNDHNDDVDIEFIILCKIGHVENVKVSVFQHQRHVGGNVFNFPDMPFSHVSHRTAVHNLFQGHGVD